MKKSFTLVELLVVIFILSTLSLVSFAYYRKGEKTFSLLRSAHSVVSQIRRAQGMAMAMEKTKEDYPKGYGVYLKKNQKQIIVFGDKDGDKKYKKTRDIKIEELKLESQIKISSLFPSSPLHIVFFPPHPETTINANENNLEAKIILTNGSETKTIKINKAGLICIE